MKRIAQGTEDTILVEVPVPSGVDVTIGRDGVLVESRSQEEGR